LLDDALKKKVVDQLKSSLGEEKVFHERTDLVPYTRDTFALRFSEEDSHFPDIVVIPDNVKEVVEVVRTAAKNSIPIIPKGGGTSRTGMLVPISGGIVIDTIRMNSLVRVDRMDMLVTVQAGMNLQELEMLLKGQGLTVGHEQGSQKIATVGGAISTAAYSRKNQKYGNLWERIASLEVVLGDGSVIRTGPEVPYSSSGVPLSYLMVGAEGTLGIITEVTLRAEAAPESTIPMLACFPDFYTAEKAADEILGKGVSFIGGAVWEDERGFSRFGFANRKGALLLAFEGTAAETDISRSVTEELVKRLGGKLAEEDITRHFWEEFPMHWCGMRAEVGNEDIIVAYVPRSKEREYFDKLIDDILPKYGLKPVPGASRSLDFGRHMILGTRFMIPGSDEGWSSYISAIDEVSSLVNSLGGTIAACHGVGLLHREHIREELGGGYLKLVGAIKKIMDPKDIMNPGKKFSI